MLQQAKNSEEKAKKAMVDAARLADELRAEQDHTNSQSKAKRALEIQLQDLENKFAEANENAIRGGRAVHTMHAEIDDMLQQAKNSEEKAKKAMVDAARLADELR